jgi:Myosin heavy chain
MSDTIRLFTAMVNYTLFYSVLFQIPNNFDIDTVQRQLRYTGMLETVRIRQAGYNVRLSYDEFIQLYRILLPQGLQR